jgi:hypothetical protein
MEKHLPLESTLYNNILYLGSTPQALYLQAQYKVHIVHIEERC